MSGCSSILLVTVAGFWSNLFISVLGNCINTAQLLLLLRLSRDVVTHPRSAPAIPDEKFITASQLEITTPPDLLVEMLTRAVPNLL